MEYRGWEDHYLVRGDPVRIGDVLDGFLRERGMDRHIRRAGVVDEWAERVGERIAKVTRAKAVSESVLFVEVKSSAWLSELDMMKRDIVARLNEGREDVPIEKIVFSLMAGD